VRLLFDVCLDGVVGRHVGRSRWLELAVVGAVLICAAQLDERSETSQVSTIVLFRKLGGEVPSKFVDWLQVGKVQ
jgi:hypothetical protein